MKTQKDTNADQNQLKRLYKEYFLSDEKFDNADESSSLLQPSPLKHVNSFTTYGITPDLLIHQGR
jgi:hypothetical protein